MECPTCGKVLPTEGGTRQHHTKVHGDPLPNRTCTGCSVEFYDSKSRRAFCDDCNPNAGAHNGNYRDATESAPCRVCGDEFDYYPSDKDGVYCPACVEAAEGLLPENPAKDIDAERLVRECDECGVEMNVLRSDWQRGESRFCSVDCLHEWMRTDGDAVYNGRWREMKRRTLRRDQHRCQNCLASSAELQQEPDVHHITPVRTFDDPQDAHTLSNLVALCKSCHIRAEVGSIPTPQP